ncbi:MAG: hypothetical protein F4X34_06065 [Chloroflexi bacterium]|nr:hypothetical protein [Chloroflexota bacterium]
MTANEVLQISQLTPSDADELLAFIRQFQQDDPLRPLTVVGPSNYAHLSLRHRLGRSGIANVQFMVFARLAEFLGAPSLSAQGKSPLTPVVGSALVREISSQATGILEPLRDHPSTHLSLRRTFRQLRHATEDALDSLAAQGGLRAETVALYREYRKRTADYYDAEDLAEAAADAVRSGSPRGLDDLGFIVFFRERGLTPAQRNLAQALAQEGKCAMLLGLTNDPDADRSAIALANELDGKENPNHPVHPVSPRAHLLVAPDAHQELRWVIRRIMRRAESGTPFHRMAVLYRKEAPYDTLIREELDLAGVPVAGPNTASLADTAVGNTLTGLLDLHESDFGRDAVMAWLTGSPLKPPPGIDPASFNPTLWDTISKRAKVLRSAETWEQRLNQFADNLERDARDWEQQGEIYESRSLRMRSDADVARQLLHFITDLIKASDSSGNTTWEDYSRWAKELLDRYLADYNALPDSEQRTYDRIERILDELQSLDTVSPQPSFEVFRRALNEALQVSVGHLGSVGHGVFVAPLNLAAAMSFGVVHIVGMIEGAVPPAVRDDPLIPERDRELAGGSAAGLPVQQQRKDDERYDYLAALATAPEHTLSYPVADPAGQRENFPSRWFLEEASRLEGTPVFSNTLPQFSGRPWMTTITSMQRSLDTAQTGTHADAHDYNMERLHTWKDAGLRADAHPLAEDGVLAASMRLSAARLGRQFTEWDGNLSASEADFANILTGRPQSPTSLERWAKCPFSYFLGSILRLSVEESPDDIYDITPLERGSLVHAILEDFIEVARNEGRLPGPSEVWSDSQRAELRHIAIRHFADAESRGITGKAVLWQIARDEMLIDLDAFLDEDLRMRRQYGVSPIGVEAEFGIDSDGWQPAELTLPDGAHVRFRGKIDRVDANDDGKRVLVLDYKTGGSYSYRKLKDDPIDRGQRLQLAIYSLAARQALGAHAKDRNPDVSAAYWFVTSGGKFELMPSPPVNIEDEGVMERFSEGISTIVGGIRSGLFPANPGSGDPNDSYNYESNCRFCDFKTLCPSRRDVQWSRKSHAPQLTDYLSLAEDEH